MRRRRRGWRNRQSMLIGMALVAAASSALIVIGVGNDTPVTPVGSLEPVVMTPPAGATVYDGSAIRALATLPIKGRAPKTGYNRDQFGETWKDVDRNGCDTRNDMLQRDLTDEVFRPGSDCVIISGWLADAYSGRVVQFVRGPETSIEVQIDHMVALSDAWQSGAQQLSLERREAFANDPLNLRATEGALNGQKGDSNAASWLPPLDAFRCEYVAHQIAVKAKYSLWVTQAEHDAMSTVLADCPDAPLPTEG